MADALSKFHTSSEIIQALWLVMVPVTIIGASACLMRAATQIAAALARRGEFQEKPIYAIYQAPDGRLIFYARGTIRELRS